jgi:hypothetical protein
MIPRAYLLLCATFSPVPPEALFREAAFKARPDAENGESEPDCFSERNQRFRDPVAQAIEIIVGNRDISPKCLFSMG